MKNQDNILFLTLMNSNKESLYKDYNDNNIVIFKKIFNWFLNSLIVIFPNLSLDNSKFFISIEKLDQLNHLITKFGTGISKCELIDAQMEELQSKLPPVIYNDFLNQFNKFYKQNSINNKTTSISIRLNSDIYFLNKRKNEYQLKKIVLKHKNDDGIYDFSEESDGTQRLFDLIEVLLEESNDKVYFIDELNRCFHPELSLEFIKTFFLKNSSSQLIVTTHESHLLDLDIVRRDEIWFSNRIKNGPTILYSLEDYGERFDKKVDKAYLDGRYGAIPLFNDYYA